MLVNFISNLYPLENGRLRNLQAERIHRSAFFSAIAGALIRSHFSSASPETLQSAALSH